MSEPSIQLADPRGLLLAYLDYYRDTVVRKLDGMPDSELRSSRLPSGWTPLELLKHLVYMERRWLRWGFDAEPVDAPWGDNRDGDPEAGWQVVADDSVESLLAMLHEGADRTRAIVEAAELDEFGRPGGRFEADQPRPTLAWILFHVLQEYARHAGHLDVVRELADNMIGE